MLPFVFGLRKTGSPELNQEGVTLLSLYLTSRKLAKRHCMSISNIINVAAVAMLLSYGDLYDEYISDAGSDKNYTGFAASLTIILLWLKLMGHFKVRYVHYTQALTNQILSSRIHRT